MTRPCASRTCSRSCLRGQCRSRCGEPWTPGRADVAPPRPFRRSQLCTLCLASATAPALTVRSRLGPNVDGVAAGSKVSYYHRVTPAGLSNRARRHPVRGVASATVATLGSVIQADEDRCFRRAACAHTGRVHGACGSGSPTRSPALAWDA